MIYKIAKYFTNFIKRQAEILESIEPSEIEVDKVSQLFFIPKWSARMLCNMAVKDGKFKKNRNNTYCLSTLHYIDGYKFRKLRKEVYQYMLDERKLMAVKTIKNNFDIGLREAKAIADEIQYRNTKKIMREKQADQYLKSEFKKLQPKKELYFKGIL